MFMIGCATSQSPTSVSSTKGTVSLSVHIGKIGSLAKTAVIAPVVGINLDSLTMDFSANGEVPQHWMIPISGNDQQIVTQSYTLAAGKQWNVQATTWANKPNSMCPQCQPQAQQVHQGSTQFMVNEGSNSAVNFYISANVSMLLVRINPIPDNANEVTLYGGSDMNQLWNQYADTSFGIMQRDPTDTVKLRYNWLPASQNPMMGMPQDIQVIIKGILNNQQTSLYWGTLHMPYVTSGVDTSYSFKLKWVGPSNTSGQQEIDCTIGRIGTVYVDGTPDIQN
jgi:hypothetical protein